MYNIIQLSVQQSVWSAVWDSHLPVQDEQRRTFLLQTVWLNTTLSRLNHNNHKASFFCSFHKYGNDSQKYLWNAVLYKMAFFCQPLQGPMRFLFMGPRIPDGAPANIEQTPTDKLFKLKHSNRRSCIVQYISFCLSSQLRSWTYSEVLWTGECRDQEVIGSQCPDTCEQRICCFQRGRMFPQTSQKKLVE